MPTATAHRALAAADLNGAAIAAPTLAATRARVGRRQQRAEQDREVLVVDRGDDVARPHAGAQADRDLAAAAARPALGRAPAGHSIRRASTAIGDGSRSRRASSWLRCSTSCGDAAGRCRDRWRRRGWRPLAAAPPLDREAEPAPAGGAEQLVGAEHVFGAAAQPAERVLGIGLDHDDDERGPRRDRLDLGGGDDDAGGVEHDRVVVDLAAEHRFGAGHGRRQTSAEAFAPGPQWRWANEASCGVEPIRRRRSGECMVRRSALRRPRRDLGPPALAARG